jgi:hypothetical protein
MAVAVVAAAFPLTNCGTSEILVPADPNPTCTVSASEFASWFESGIVTEHGVVNPADSVNFSNIPNCDFYRWSEQMFLWLTSPAPPRYGGGGGRIFNSPAFYDVSPIEGGTATFLPHPAGGPLLNSLRAAQVGPHRLPILLSKSGEVFSVEPPVLAESGRQLVLDEQGRRVEIADAEIAVDGRPVFRDLEGEVIRGARPIIRRELMDAKVVQEFRVQDVSIFLGPLGQVIDVEQGQAGGQQVLMARNGSLVYFRATVNDVFAYFLTGVKNGDIPSPGGDPLQAQFPTTQAALDQVISFAAAHGKTLVDPEALAIEIKSSWIETNLLSGPERFIRLQGTLPTYDKSDPNRWVANGQKTVELALVGMHVVGSTKGHPEMIWATFEHVSATPNAEYSYNSTSGAKTVAQDTTGNWLFCSDGSAGPFNQPHMVYDSIDHAIEPLPGHTFSPSDTIRWKAWGKASPGASSNTELISINNSVLGMLAAADVRKNYIMTGSTWTIGGAPPTGSNQVGTNLLANTTMETYQQGTSNGNNGLNCFSCHGTNKVQVSHIFGPLQPLF